jgi:hypothetical protein
MKISTRPFFLVLAVLCSPAVDAQTNPDSGFATRDEVTLLATQTKRAVADYANAVELEGKLAKDQEEIADDKKLIAGLRELATAFIANPEKFNQASAFQYILMLDDASRNATLCFGSSMQGGMKALATHDSELAENYLALANKCNAASSSLYMVSENAAALYQKFLNAFDDLAHKAVDEMERCTGILKKNPPKQ